MNGVQVLAKGEHTGAKPGQVVRGAGYETVDETPNFQTPRTQWLYTLRDYTQSRGLNSKHPKFETSQKSRNSRSGP